MYYILGVLQTRLLMNLMQVMLEAQALYSSHYDSVKRRVNTAEDVIKAMNPAADRDVFIDHNIRPFQLPPNWDFEPCSTHYDTVSRTVAAIR